MPNMMSPALLAAACVVGVSAVRMHSATFVLTGNKDSSGCSVWNDVDDLGSFPNWLAYTIAAAGMLIGLFETGWGYKYWSVTVFVICGYVCGAIVFSVVNSTVDENNDNRYYYAYGAGAAAGLVGGLLFSLFRRPAVFCIGAGLGVVLALFLQPLCLAYIWDEKPNVVLYVMMGILGLICGLIVLILERTMVIIATAFIGAFVFIYSLGEVAGNLPSLASSYYATIVSDGIGCVAWQVWAYFGGWIALGLVGLMLQCAVTAKDVDHRRSDKEKRQRQEEEVAFAYTGGNGGVKYV